MKTKFAKLFSSFAMMATFCFTSVVVCASEINDNGYTETLTIEDCAANIKSVYTADYPGQEVIINNIVDTISSSEVFATVFEDEGSKAFQIIEDSLQDALNPEPSVHMQTDDLYISKYSFPIIQQMNSYYCGPASVLMALIGSGADDYYYTTNSTITNAWQSALASSMGTASAGTDISEITRVLKENISSVNGYTYKTKAFTKYTYGLALGFIETSLVNDAIPVIRVSDTALLGYYNNTSCCHYMIVESVDFNSECVNLVDPNNDNVYYGRHSISFSEFNYLAENCGDFWVSVYTKASSDNSYIYT